MIQWAHVMSEHYLAEQIGQNPQAIWELFPDAGELIEDAGRKIQAGELLESEAEELVRTATERAKRDWIGRVGRELIRWIVAFETGQDTDEIVKQIRAGDQQAALLLADSIDPEPGTPEYEAMTKIKRSNKDDAPFCSAIDQALEHAREKEKPEARRRSPEGEILSTKRLMEIFFWIKFNEAWLREEDTTSETAYKALREYFGKAEDLPRPESFGRMLQFLGIDRP
jgi:hypothetical protein